MPDSKNIFLNKPQINISYSSTGRMWLVFFCAFLCVLQSAINDNGVSLIPSLAALITAVFTEFLLTHKTYGASKILDGSAAATAMVLSLMLPNQLHPVYAVFGAAFAIIVVKYSFGGLGANWLNPALGGWLFIKLSWPKVFTDALGESLSITELGGSTDISAIDNTATELLNTAVFSFTGVQLPSGYIDLLFNSENAIIADRGLFFLLIGTIFITAAAINRGWIPLVFLSVFGFLVRFAGDASGIYWNGDLLYGLFSGGTIAAAFILIAEPASSAKTRKGVLITVILGAVLAWFIRYKCGEYFGTFIALALINCFAPLVRLAEDKLFIFYKNKDKLTENIL